MLRRLTDTSNGIRWLHLSIGARLFSILAVAWVIACGTSPECDIEPADSSIEFLEREIVTALLAIQDSEQRASSRERDDSLRSARSSLLRIEGYYLPLLKARQGAETANRWMHLRKPHRALRDLAAVEREILRACEHPEPAVATEVRPTLEQVAKSREVIQSGQPGGPEMLVALRDQIDYLLKNGDRYLRIPYLRDG